MELLTLKDVNLTNLDKRFKQSAIGKLVGVFIPLGFCTLIVSLHFKGEMGLPPTLISTAIFLLLSIYILKMFIKNIGPNSWNLAICPGVILVKFRSFFNNHFPETDPQVVRLAVSEIKSVHITKQKLKYKTRGNSKNGSKRTGTCTKYQTFLDINLNNVDLAALAKQLDYEHSLKHSKNGSAGKSRARHFPVRVMMPDTIRLEWFTKNTQLKPGIKKAVELLEQQGICIEEKQKEVMDYTEIASKDPQEINKVISELALRESKMAAIEIARNQYNYGLKEAKDFVENLMDSE
jgi:ribosomal protein L7/L12